MITRFITKIELLDANAGDYMMLDMELEKYFFVNSVMEVSQDKKTSLHNATYFVKGNMTLKDMTTSAFNAASKTGKKFTFTVIKDKMPGAGTLKRKLEIY